MQGYFDTESYKNSNLSALISTDIYFNYTAPGSGSSVNRFLPCNERVFRTSTIYQVTVTRREGGRNSAFSFSFGDGLFIFNQTRSAADDRDKLNSYPDILLSQTIPNSKWAIFLAYDIAPADSIIYGKVTDYHPVSTQRLTSLCEW